VARALRLDEDSLVGPQVHGELAQVLQLAVGVA
jgi:hypothetical protein